MSAKRSTGRQTRNGQVEATRTEERRIGLIDLAKRRIASGLDETCMFEHQLGCQAINGARPVVWPPLGWGPFLGQWRVIDVGGIGAGRDCEREDRHGKTRMGRHARTSGFG